MITSWIKNSKKKLLYTDKKLFISKLPTIEPFLILLSYSPLWVLQLSLRFPGCPKSGLFHKWLFLPRVCDLTLTYPKYPSLWVYNIKPSLILSTHRPGFTIGLSLIPNANQPGLQWALPASLSTRHTGFTIRPSLVPTAYHPGFTISLLLFWVTDSTLFTIGPSTFTRILKLSPVL